MGRQCDTHEAGIQGSTFNVGSPWQAAFPSVNWNHCSASIDPLFNLQVQSGNNSAVNLVLRLVHLVARREKCRVNRP